MPREFAGLKPHERVLDIGCGPGRWAIALTGYLTPEGGYEGFDIVPDRIARCREQIGHEYPNFNFQHVDVFNKHYNPEGTIQARDFRFPFEDEQFDLALLSSVFTHMLPEDVEQYFSEISRVLRRGGRMLATYCLLNEQSLELLGRGIGGLHFDHDFGVYRATNPDVHEAVTAYREDYILCLYERFGLRLTRPIHYVGWATKKERPWGQDVIVAEKT